MKFNKRQIVSLTVNSTIVDIRIQVPVSEGQELVDHFNQGVTDFVLTPEIAPASAGDVPVSEQDKPKRSKK